MQDLIAQRLYAIICGYEDLNDHDQLRNDPLMQTAVGKYAQLGSASTLCRLEGNITRQDIVALNKILVEQFINAYESAPKELILDIDASDVPLHGEQELRAFHGYYDSYCFLPLYVYEGKSMLACVSRPCRIDGAKHAAAIIKLLVTRLRQVWPNTRFILRADSGFCRQLLINWCERNDVDYIIGVAKNNRLKNKVKV